MSSTLAGLGKYSTDMSLKRYNNVLKYNSVKCEICENSVFEQDFLVFQACMIDTTVLQTNKENLFIWIVFLY